MRASRVLSFERSLPGIRFVPNTVVNEFVLLNSKAIKTWNRPHDKPVVKKFESNGFRNVVASIAFPPSIARGVPRPEIFFDLEGDGVYLLEDFPPPSNNVAAQTENYYVAVRGHEIAFLGTRKTAVEGVINKLRATDDYDKAMRGALYGLHPELLTEIDSTLLGALIDVDF